MLSMSSLQAEFKNIFTLFDTQVSIDRGVSGGSGQVLSFSVRNVFSISLDVPFGKAEIENEDLVAGFVESDAEVVGLDVPVDEVAVVDVLNSLNHLVDKDEDSLQREFPEGLVEEGFKGGAHEIHNEDVVVT
jgi:hypothetical protein